MDNLAQVAPPDPNVGDTAVITSTRDGAATPSITLPETTSSQEDSRPQSPPTLIPATDTLSTRPTRGGVAYPFSLKVDGQERDVNASTVTLQSMSLQSPGIEHEGKELTTANGVVGEKMSINSTDGVGAHVDGDEMRVEETVNEKPADEANGEPQRPGTERFLTAATTALLYGIGDDGEERVERPGVERFETAREDLATVNGKA